MTIQSTLNYATPSDSTTTFYPPRTVGLATFLGSPLAGSVILAINFRRLGQPGAAVKAIVVGTLATAVLLAIGFVLPSSASYIPAIFAVLLMNKIAIKLQGAQFASHQAAGNPVASAWKAAGIGLLGLALIFSIIFASVFSFNLLNQRSLGKSVAFGSSQVYYSGSATPADAQTVGKALTDIGYFGSSNAVSVSIAKDRIGTVVQFVVKPDAADKPEIVQAFHEIGDSVATSLGGTSITVKLVTPELKNLKSFETN